MRTNRIIRNTVIGLSAFVGSSNFTPANSSVVSSALTAKNISTEVVNTAAKNCVKSVYHVKRKQLPLEGTTIMVNPGHNVVKPAKGKIKSYYDQGAHGRLGKKIIYEMDINAKVAENVARKFKLLGANVVYIQKTLVDTIMAKENKIHPDLFIAIHHDAKASERNSKNSGETIYCWGASKKVGKFINDVFKKDSTIKNNQNSPAWASGLKVLEADSTINAVLVEGGFMTNPKELRILNSPEYQDKEAQMIVDGSRNFLKTIKAKKAQLEKELKIRQEQEFRKSILWFDENKKEGYQAPIYMQPEGRDI